MKSPFQLAAPKLRANGYSVIPILPKSKRPAIEKWTEFSIKPADDETFNRWLSWKDMNVGVCLGVASNIMGLDYDADQNGLHEKIKALVPPSPISKVGALGCTSIYQFNGQKSSGFSKNGIRVLDILSQGRQTVLPPSFHPDGFEYRWLTAQTLENTLASDLPHIPLSAIYEIGKLFGAEQQPHVVQPRQTMVYDDTQPAEVQEALTYIPADDYDLWVRIGMGLKDKFGDRAFSIWDNWSRTSGKYNAGEMQCKWNSFHGMGITIASIFYHALDNGYSNMSTDYFLPQNTEHFELNGRMTGAQTTHTPKPEMVAWAHAAEPAEVKKTDSILFPSELLDAPGLIAPLSAFINKTSIMPQPVLALAASIAAAGTLMGRKVRGDTNLRTNTYIIGLAPSASGKDHARTVLKRMFHDGGLPELEMGVPASSAGLITGIRNGSGRGIILWDEFGRVLQQISSWKSGSHEKDIVTALVELFSSSQSVYQGKQYANHDGKNPMKPIDQPCLSIYATSVPGRFYDAISGSEAIDGFLSRWLLVESKDYTMEEEDREDSFSETPQALVDLCKYWKEQSFYHGEAKGNLDDSTRIVPKLIPCTVAAKSLLKDFATETRKIARTNELAGENTAPIWGRAGEHARRLALIAHEGDQIEIKSAEWAIKMARYCCNYMSSAIADYVSSTELESQTKRMLRTIKEKTKTSDTWVTRADISKLFQGVQARTRMEIIGSLVERGEIIEAKEGNSQGRPKLRYRAVAI